GEYKKKIEYLTKALIIQENAFGKNHPDTAKILQNLGTTNIELGDYTKAINYLQDALVIYRKVCDKWHPEIGMALLNLGATYGASGEYIKQLQYAQEALVILERVFGKDHPNVAKALYNQNQALSALTPGISLPENTYIINSDAIGNQGKVEVGKVLKPKTFVDKPLKYDISPITTPERRERLMYAITLKSRDEVAYCKKLPRETITKELQKEIDSNPNISCKSYLYAYYELITQSSVLGLNRNEIRKHIRDFEKSVVKENNAFSYSLLGYAYKSIDRYEQASQWFKKAYDIDPDYSLAKESYLACNKLCSRAR
ncbi:MAG: tetratricopeptide repeat protein, partial [Burkholderiales bacterium]